MPNFYSIECEFRKKHNLKNTCEVGALTRRKRSCIVYIPALFKLGTKRQVNSNYSGVCHAIYWVNKEYYANAWVGGAPASLENGKT